MLMCVSGCFHRAFTENWCVVHVCEQAASESRVASLEAELVRWLVVGVVVAVITAGCDC